jgi:replicative DNA helicase
MGIDRLRSHDMEVAVLSAMLVDPAICPAVFLRVPVDAFSTDVHREIYLAMQRIIQTLPALDPVVVAQELSGKPEAARYLVGRIATSKAVPENWEYYVDQVLEAWERRKLWHTLHKAKLELEAGSSAWDIRSSLVREFRSAPLPQRVQTLKDVVVATSVAERPDLIPTGFADIDWAVGGWGPGDLWIVLGGTSRGKSLLLAQWWIETASRHPALLASNEMSPAEYVYRAVAGRTGRSVTDVRAGRVEIPQDSWPEHAYLASEVYYVEDLWAIVSALASRVELKWVALDWLQLLRSKARHESRVQELDALAAALKHIAQHFHVAVVVAGQVDKATAWRKEIDIASVRGSLMPVLAADVVLALQDPEDGHETSEALTTNGIPLVLRVLKARQGRAGVRQLIWCDWTGMKMLAGKPGSIPLDKLRKPRYNTVAYSAERGNSNG